MTKTEIRKRYKILRKQFTESELEDKSLAIANQLLKLDIWQYSFYHIFLPIERQKEVNTEYVLNILAGKDKNIVISKSDFEDYSMSHYLLTDNTKLKKNTYGIPEPIDGIPISPQQIDVVFVPLLAFDIKGIGLVTAKVFMTVFLLNVEKKLLRLVCLFLMQKKKLK